MSHLHGSYSKFNGSWRPNDSASSINNSWHQEDKIEENKPAIEEETKAEEAQEEKQIPVWLTQDQMTGRPDDYVGGYSPAWIHAYRQRQAAKKTIKIEGYNAPKKF